MMTELFDELASDPLLKAVEGPDNLILFNASKKLFSPKSFSQEQAKGIIFKRDTKELVSMPFEKMYNWHERDRVRQFALDLLKADHDYAIMSKIDGTLIHVFWHNDRFLVTTRGSFDNYHITAAKEMIPFDALDKNHTYLFELVVPWNQIVTSYSGASFLALLAVKDKITDYDYMLDSTHIEAVNRIRSKIMESNHLVWLDFDRSRVKGLDPKDKIEKLFKDIEECFDHNQSHIPEGFMILFYKDDRVVLRVKVKTKQYIEALKVVKNISQKSVFQLCLESDFSSEQEFIDSMLSVNLPEEVLDDAITYYQYYEKCLHEGEEIWSKIDQDILDNYEEGFEKRFAVWVKREIDKNLHKFYFLKMRKKECSFKYFLEQYYN